MKRLILLAVLALMLVCPVAATNLDMQQFGDMNYINKTESHYNAGYTSNGYVNYDNTTSSYKNNYVVATGSTLCGGNPDAFALNAVGAYMTYAASTVWASQAYYVGGKGPRVRFYDTNKAVTYTIQIPYNSSEQYPYRLEVVVSGGTGYAYVDGVMVANTTPLSSSPYYIGFGNPIGLSSCSGGGYAWFDDYVWGDLENKYVFGMPEYEKYIIVKDVVSPASNGFAHVSNHTVISSNNMTTTWSKGYQSNPANETVVIQQYGTEINYGITYTGTNGSGYMTWNLNDVFFNSGAPYGIYVTTIPGSGILSDPIVFTGTGASVILDKTEYSRGMHAYATYNISPTYWDGGSTYRMDLMSIYGTVVDTESVSTPNGTADFEFEESDDEGVYYAVLIKDGGGAGSDIWIGFDYAELSAYATLYGYVNNAETMAVISGANVRFTQGSTVLNITTPSDGNYTASGFGTGDGVVAVMANATGYVQYDYSFTLLTSDTRYLNISLCPATLSNMSGIGLGGIVREALYGSPIQDAYVTVYNATTGQEYIKTTSMTGWYLCDEGASCWLQTKTPYSVWGNKTGYANSTVYSAVTA